MSDKVRAYVLVEVEIGKTDHVVEELRKIDEATRVAVTTGIVDIVVLLEVDTLEALYDVTVHRIHAIPGIKDTSTAVIEKMIN